MQQIHTISNNKGMSISCSEIGAGLIDIRVPDKNGQIESVLVHPENIDEYVFAEEYFGKSCGRTAGRISDASFELDGNKYKIQVPNNSEHALHGGMDGISFKHFSCTKAEDAESKTLIFNYLSKDGESGYPGNLNVTISFRLMEKENRLIVRHEATTDKKTLCNLTCHVYLNLAGNVKKSGKEQTLYLNASKVGKVDKDTIARELTDVDQAFDFSVPHQIKDFLEEEEVQRYTHGYDHPYLLNKHSRKDVVASLSEKESGRLLEIKSSYESAVIFTANYDLNHIVQNSKKFKKYDACCIELQHFPNAVNSPFITDKKDILSAGNRYDEYIEFNFSIL